MQYNQIDKNTSVDITRAFYGYNHAPVIADGEFYEMQNLTSDHYPLLSPRAKRGLQLSVASNTWESVSVNVTYVSDVDITKATLECKTNKITIGENTRIHFTYSIDDTIIDSAEGVVVFTTSKGEVKKALDEYFTTPAGTTKMQITVKGTCDHPEDFDLEDVDTYIYDCTCSYRNDNVRGILCKDSKLAYLIKKTLYYNEQTYDLSSYMTGDDGVSDQTLLSYGAYILIFPAGVYLNTVDTTDKGSLGQKNSIVGTVTYSMVDRTGTAINPTVSSTEPGTRDDGDYWLDTKVESYGLYVWVASLNMWEPVLTTYIKIAIAGIGAGLSEGDAVYMNTKLTDINNGSILQKVDTDYVIVTALMNAATDSEVFSSGSPFVIERRIPTLDYVCVNNNRVWGCHSGIEDGAVVNEIYASKLGDPKNWYCYEGLASDSYTLSIGSDGDFTGAVAFQGYPTFFKENVVYRIYGSYPAQYQLITYDCRGVQQGSGKSIAIVGEYLIYKSVKDICIFDGSNPTSISEALGEEMYHDAVAGSCLMKYYVSMIDKNNESHLFVFDLAKRLWHREDNLRIEEFTYNNSGQLYGRDGLKVYGFGLAKDSLTLTEEDGEKHVHWSVVTGEYYTLSNTRTRYPIPGHFYPVRASIRAKIPFKNEVRVEISYDDGEWMDLVTLRGDGVVKTYSFTLKSQRCDHFRLRISGRDECYIYSIMREFEAGGEWNGAN